MDFDYWTIDKLFHRSVRSTIKHINFTNHWVSLLSINIRAKYETGFHWQVDFCQRFVRQGLARLLLQKNIRHCRLLLLKILGITEIDSIETKLISTTEPLIGWLATCTQKPKVPDSSLAANYVQRWALYSNHLANV